MARFHGKDYSNNPNYRFVANETCTKCDGSGQFLHHGACFRCDGTGAHSYYTPTDEWAAVLAERRAKRNARKRAKRDAAYAAALAANPWLTGLALFLNATTADDWAQRLGWAVFERVTNGKTVSNNQAAALLKCALRSRAWHERRVAEAKAARPVVVGKGIVITGEIVSIKWRDSDWGGDYKITVKDDRNFRVWGTAPRAILDAVAVGTIEAALKGARVEFTANVTASDDDETFGFFKRPRKASVTLTAEGK